MRGVDSYSEIVHERAMGWGRAGDGEGSGDGDEFMHTNADPHARSGDTMNTLSRCGQPTLIHHHLKRVAQKGAKSSGAEISVWFHVMGKAIGFSTWV